MSVTTAVRNPRAFVANRWNTVRLILFDPEQFYEELDTSDRIWSEIAVVLFVGLAGAIGGYVLASTIMSNLYAGSALGGTDAEFGVSGDIATQILGQGFRDVFAVFAIWVAFAVAMYAISWLYSPKGSFFSVAKATAWALVPLLIGNLLKSITYVVASLGAWETGPLSEVTTTDFNRATNEVVAYLYTQLFEQPIAIGGILVGGLFIVWTGYIAAHGLASVREIPVSDAYKVAAVPTVVYLGTLLLRVIDLAGVL